MVGLQDLPNELILEIVERLGHRQCLSSIIRTSKYFHELANPILYHKICLEVPQSCSWKDGVPVTALRLLRTLLENPKVGMVTEELQIDTAGLIHREILAMLQQQKLLVQWQGRLLTREREALERETSQLQEYLTLQARKLKFLFAQGSSEKSSAQLQDGLSPSALPEQEEFSKSELRDSTNSDQLKAPPAQDEAFQLYGMVDGSVSQAIASRKAEVTAALERNETDFRQNFGLVSTKSIGARLAVNLISGAEKQLLKNEFLPILTKALLPGWANDASNVDPGQEVSEELRMRNESLLVDLRTRVQLLLKAISSHFQLFQEHEDVSLFALVDGLISFLPNLKRLNLNIPQTCSIPRIELAPLPSRHKEQYLGRLTEISLAYSDGHINASHLKHLFELPSLKSMEVWGCFGFGPKKAQAFDYKDSSVTKLAFKGSMLAPRWLQAIVKRCSVLQYLEYSHSATEASPMTAIYPAGLVLALRQHHENLITLRCDTPDDISGCGGDGGSIASFHLFSKMTTLDVCIGAVLFHSRPDQNSASELVIANPNAVDEVVPLYQRLPTTLQYLILRHCHEKGTSHLLTQLKDLLPKAKEFLPYLRSIALTSPDFDYLDRLTTLRAQFTARGIQLLSEVCEPSRNCAHCRADEEAAGSSLERVRASLDSVDS